MSRRWLPTTFWKDGKWGKVDPPSWPRGIRHSHKQPSPSQHLYRPEILVSPSNFLPGLSEHLLAQVSWRGVGKEGKSWSGLGPRVPGTNLDHGIIDTVGWRGPSRVNCWVVGRRTEVAWVGGTGPHGGTSPEIWILHQKVFNSAMLHWDQMPREWAVFQLALNCTPDSLALLLVSKCCECQENQTP